MLQQRPQKGQRTESEKVAKTREETTPVRTREEGARDQEGAVLSSFATTETNEQLKKAREWDPRIQEENSQGSGPKNREQTARDGDLRTREENRQGRDPRTQERKSSANSRHEREVHGEGVDKQTRKLMHRNRWNTQTKSSAATWARKASKSETYQFFAECT